MKQKLIAKMKWAKARNKAVESVVGPPKEQRTTTTVQYTRINLLKRLTENANV